MPWATRSLPCVTPKSGSLSPLDQPYTRRDNNISMPADADRSARSTDDLGSTLDFIQSARRPILIQRHQAAITEMEGGISDGLLSGANANPRFKAMVEGLERPEAQEKTRHMLTALGEDVHYREHTLQRALIEELCLSRERAGHEVAALQQQCIGIYLMVRSLYIARDGEPSPCLDEIRAMTTASIGALFLPAPAKEFARLVLGQPRPRSVIDTVVKQVRALLKQPNMDVQWDEAEGLPILNDEDLEAIAKLPEGDQEPTRVLLQRDRVRSSFYKQVFLIYFAADEFDPREAEGKTVLAWLQALDETPHLYPFLQGQNHRQKAWRVAQLVQKVLQLHEIYARVQHATENPRHRDELAGKSFRERMGIINKLHYPPLPNTGELTVGAMLCPLLTFVEWVQARVVDKDFMVPPDPKK